MTKHRNQTRRRWFAQPATIMIALTLTACVTALVFRTPLRSRYWAWSIGRETDPVARAVQLTHLCNAGNGGRWGTAALLADQRTEIRQYGVIVLQHVRTDWSRARLLEMLRDSDADVRELAALGLAMHGDERVIPTLREMFESGEERAASAACVALERLATPTAVAALSELVARPNSPAQCAYLIDALSGIGTPVCVPPLLMMLDDERPCGLPPRATRLAQDVLQGLQLEAPGVLAASQPASVAGAIGGTIAERAAEGLTHITGLDQAYSPDLPATDKRNARARWKAWWAARIESP